MSVQFEKNSMVGDLQIKTRRLSFDISITANATPASKKHASDLPGVCLLRTEGITAAADAVEDLSGSFTTAADNSSGNSQFGILLKGSELGSIKRVKRVQLTQVLATGTAIVVAGLSNSFLSAGGNIVIDVTGTGTNLASESPTFHVEVIYELN
jgi:hypothetical protein